jgi:iron uptake system component EfeO
MPASGRTALDDPELAGFHRIEALLWSGRPVSDAASPADALVGAVRHLRTSFPTARIDPLDIGLRAHEILENALQFEATGRSDAGSHTNLATIDANIDGTRAALDPIRGVLESRYPQLAETERSLDALQRTVRAHDHDGTWAPLDDLTPTERRTLNARLDASLELLAPVAAICDIRRTT